MVSYLSWAQLIIPGVDVTQAWPVSLLSRGTGEWTQRRACSSAAAGSQLPGLPSRNEGVRVASPEGRRRATNKQTRDKEQNPRNRAGPFPPDKRSLSLKDLLKTLEMLPELSSAPGSSLLILYPLSDICNPKNRVPDTRHFAKHHRQIF